MEEPAKIEEPQRMKESEKMEETPQKMEEATDFVVKRGYFFSCLKQKQLEIVKVLLDEEIFSAFYQWDTAKFMLRLPSFYF